jgi:hypothetical protein
MKHKVGIGAVVILVIAILFIGVQAIAAYSFSKTINLNEDRCGATVTVGHYVLGVTGYFDVLWLGCAGEIVHARYGVPLKMGAIFKETWIMYPCQAPCVRSVRVESTLNPYFWSMTATPEGLPCRR